MSYTAAETGRVKSIKSKFENLNSIESLDISATVPNKYRKPSPKFFFKRSSTSIDLPISRIAVANKSPVQSPSDNETNKSYLRRHNNLGRTTSADAFVVKKRNCIVNDADTLKPLKEIKENVEVRLQRHTNDPVKRSSIKRSPAFRVGDKSSCSNNNNSKNIGNFKSNRNDNTNGTTTVPPVVPKEFADKFENLLKRCDMEMKDDLMEPGLSDTLKAVLRRPLPTTAPPKKPPRTFIDSPKQVQKLDNVNGSDEEKSQKHRNLVPTNQMKQKIDFIENSLILKTNSRTKGGRTNVPKEKSPFSSSLLNCIPCSSASIYDTMIVASNQFGKGTVTTAKEPSPEKCIQTNRNFHTASNRHSNARTSTDPIYMEPFAHLKQNAKIGNGATPNTHNNKHCNSSYGVTPNHLTAEPKLSSSISNGSFDGPESLGSSLTSCTSCTADDHSFTDLHDIHYMVSWFCSQFQHCTNET